MAVNAASGDVFDLSPLIRKSDNWVVVDVRHPAGSTASGYEYDINVCRPLVQTARITGECAGEGVVGCKMKRNDASFVPQSLGWAAKPQFKNGAITADSHFGSPCVANSGIPGGSHIEFTCNPSVGLGHPVFREETEDCIAVFDWATSVACPAREEVGEHCVVTDSRTGELACYAGCGACAPPLPCLPLPAVPLPCLQRAPLADHASLSMLLMCKHILRPCVRGHSCICAHSSPVLMLPPPHPPFCPFHSYPCVLHDGVTFRRLRVQSQLAIHEDRRLYRFGWHPRLCHQHLRCPCH